MINLGVDDIHRVYAGLCAKGVSFLKPPTQEYWGGWVATFFDPDGNILQLLQQPAR
jgi:lactoylglutathione lyase